MIAPASNALFQKLAEALDRPDFINDERFHDSPSRLKNKALIEGLVGDILKTKDQTHWLNILGNAGVPCSPVNTVPQALNHEQATALGIMQTDPDSAEISSIGFPVSFNGKRPKVKQGAPELNSANLSALLNR